MPNQNGSLYGFTLLCPIRTDDSAEYSHDLEIRKYLATLPTDERSPFAMAPGTHLARLAVMDDVIYVGMPACEEHLRSKYLVFETNCDSNFDDYFRGLATAVPGVLDDIWNHCTGYPKVSDLLGFLRYMKACQIDTTFFFAAVNDKNREQTLSALQTQRQVADFVMDHQGVDPAVVQKEFLQFVKHLRTLPVPAAGGKLPRRLMKTGGHNE